MHWLNSENKHSSTDNPIIVKEFVNDKYALLYDSVTDTDVIVVLNDGVPFCKRCNSDECVHVGFIICLEHLHGRGETIESIDAENDVSGEEYGNNQNNPSSNHSHSSQLSNYWITLPVLVLGLPTVILVLMTRGKTYNIVY